MRGIVLSRQAERDLRTMRDARTLARIGEALSALAAGEPTLDARPLIGAAPWHSLRVGDHRILYRPVDPAEAVDPGTRWLVARIVHRRDLERATSTLA